LLFSILSLFSLGAQKINHPSYCSDHWRSCCPGEYCIRTLTTKSVCDRIAAGMSAADAARDTLDEVNRLAGPDTGMIVADLAGRVAAVHATEAMPHAFATSEDPSPTALMVAP
jgi:isoaspartyl peptidase/L-asparaginase-like protein (Ntn-hydrolase superfamily)